MSTNFVSIVLALFFTIYFSTKILAEELTVTTKLNNCKAELSDGSIINLSEIDDENNPREAMDKIDTGYKYRYNPCSPIQCRTSDTNSAVCV